MSEHPRVALLIETSLASGRDILSGIARYLRDHQPWSLYHEPRGFSDSTLPWLKHWRGEGIIARIQSERIADEIKATELPAVDVLGALPNPSFPLVHVDNAAIGRMAAEHLLARGLRHFGYLGISDENWSRQRYQAFSRAVQPAAPTVSVCESPRGPSDARSWQHRLETVTAWIRSLPKPVGVFVCGDEKGLLLLEACRQAGAAVPEDVAAVSVDDDHPLCEVCDPPLSSIQARHEDVGYRAAAMLNSLMQGAAPPQYPLLVEPERVVARRSTDILAIDDPAIAHALLLIRDRAYENIKVDDIARQVGLSRSVLQRRFRTHLRRTVHEEILNTKVRYARELLVKSSLPIAIVAQRSGFNHQEYLGMVLKRRFGKTPRAIRRGATDM